MSLSYHIKRWWYQRQLALIRHRREELKCIIRRENLNLDDEEDSANQRLRELESNSLHERIRKTSGM